MIWRTSTAIILLLSMCFPGYSGESSTDGSASQNPNFHIYLLLGGKNMAGRARFNKAETAVIPRAYLFNRNDKWQPAASPMNRYSSIIEQLSTQDFGPAHTFAQTMTESLPSKAIGIICNARGKSSIDDWKKGSTYYKEAIRRAMAAKQYGVIKGILWHQGERDVKKTDYVELLKQLISDFRNDLGNENLPFIAGELLDKKQFNTQLAKLPKQTSNTMVVSSSGMKGWKSGGFDTAGVKVLGKSYAQAMLKLNSSTGANTSGEAPTFPSPAPTYKGSKENLHIYLLIGQSNMAGRAAFSAEDGKPIDGCWLLNDKGNFEPAEAPFNRYCTIIDRMDTNGLNLGYGFALAMRKNNPSVQIGLISNARGSTSIMQWRKKSRYYKQAMARIKSAQKIGILKGILWHQGESDERDEKYLEKLVQMVKDYRAELGMPELPFVAGQIMNTERKKQGATINPQVAKLPASLPMTGMASSEGLTAMDRWHFDNKSIKILGQRYAEAMIKLQEKNNFPALLLGDGK